MAVVNTKSTLILNRDAFPPALSPSYLAGAGDTISVATVAAAATDGIGSTYRFGFISSGARIHDIQLANDATTTGVWNLGIALNDQQSLNLGGGPAPSVQSWSSTVAYVPGNVVLNSGVVFYCTAGNTNSQPPSGNWTTGGAQIVAPSSVPIPNAGQIFGSGISTASANTVWKSVYTPSIGAVGAAAYNMNLRVWELLGMIQDPGYEFHMVLTATTAPTGAGSISLQYFWVR
jgi:hypothetical protein